ncbi:methionine ABC transporter ATP-binding protein [Jeotgalibaca ciconiae]|uniref:ATP-binding cassette domain-containing protein n=1 Tax=Jeotgalibaca ciconiae TaxID=2496265 RepID=A0A3Q9BK34_9LACT|nr:ATP-binding cassette domain-containing protein [Jeotgalibaca ciconiae]AZP04112.1 ATP-binding cassette domain-containing protein [Jeotgalibaca ciconiae]HJB23813.1 ATP-binding cassette domain-containing protein [Candidatus Jeotgalibaca pullicola]
MIDLKNVSVTFSGDQQKEIKAVQDVSLRVAEGDVYGIVGYSGAGKSTLVRTINLLQRPTNGQVVVNNKILTNMNESELRNARKKIGMIFQHFNLMDSRTIFDNVAFPLKRSTLTKKEINDKVLDLLELVGLGDKAKAYPSQLSGGQKQRVAIARALANDPEILLCDEATSALDPKTTSSILALLKKLNKDLNLTIVIITHEMQVVKEICNKVAVMEDGYVIEKGSLLEIFTSPQNQLTKDFINTATHVDQGIETVLTHPTLLNLKENDVLAKLSFVGGSTSEPLIAKLNNSFQVQGNILFGNVEILQDTPVGTLLLVLSGSTEKIAEAIDYLQANEVTVSIISTEYIEERQKKEEGE